MEKKLKRGTNKMIAGVCSGIADYLGIDVTILRILVVICSLFLGIIFPIILYLIVALLMESGK